MKTIQNVFEIEASEEVIKEMKRRLAETQPMSEEEKQANEDQDFLER